MDGKQGGTFDALRKATQWPQEAGKGSMSKAGWKEEEVNVLTKPAVVRRSDTGLWIGLRSGLKVFGRPGEPGSKLEVELDSGERVEIVVPPQRLSWSAPKD